MLYDLAAGAASRCTGLVVEVLRGAREQPYEEEACVPLLRRLETQTPGLLPADLASVFRSPRGAESPLH